MRDVYACVSLEHKPDSTNKKETPVARFWATGLPELWATGFPEMRATGFPGKTDG
jgi:hypothetical protein